MDRKLLIAGTFFGMTAIVLGAFGAHALKQILNAEQLQTFETGVKYQMYHALFLLFVGAYSGISAKSKNIIFWLIFTGVIFFSGSIYLLATGAAENFNKIIGPITPIGGMLLIIGWFVLLIDFFRQKS
ncbi:DUF423 domain-containing protein [Flavobacterium sp. MAH-1]|uniref:DUF423 domain-containing protein n=1 Tax=Flavobacterium agri TaxID=2743471 RepID=A0A7Y9C556_9FLAO|nr:DUF423 domain-containing protein [Flavobacterium agri]NUY80596.1 DUF423 domain-containing protein [Flavobacterium agri]NYA70620.1 DUF423 domain-containing protein [Flavobacterium agri]